MDTATDTTPENRTRDETWVPSVSASLIVVQATPVMATDESIAGARVRLVTLHVGEIALHLGVSDDDAEVVDVIDRLLEPLQELRSAALRRLAKS